ncbi:MAG: hypothetical protein LBU05_06375 [Bifidobacteriaceae bacterium]|nr:hypothetical protein [Bifidobacteriaceae bacterium]
MPVREGHDGDINYRSPQREQAQGAEEVDLQAHPGQWVGRLVTKGDPAAATAVIEAARLSLDLVAERESNPPQNLVGLDFCRGSSDDRPINPLGDVCQAVDIRRGNWVYHYFIRPTEAGDAWVAEETGRNKAWQDNEPFRLDALDAELIAGARDLRTALGSRASEMDLSVEPSSEGSGVELSMLCKTERDLCEFTVNQSGAIWELSQMPW